MIDLFHATKQISATIGNEPAVVLFSGGKEAVAVGDLLMAHHKGPLHWVFFYLVDGLEIVESVLRSCEKRWGIEIERRPSHEALSLQSRLIGGRKYRLGEIYDAYKEELGVSWEISGCRRQDGLSRRGMMKICGDSGIDMERKKCYPVIDWSEKQIFSYLKMRRLPQMRTYQHGIKCSFYIPSLEFLMWLRGIYPQDYERIVNTFPQYADAVFRRENGR